LDRRLLVDAEHDRVLARMQVQADDIADFAAKVGSRLTLYVRTR
jgi:hypothetical protein